MCIRDRYMGLFEYGDYCLNYGIYFHDVSYFTDQYNCSSEVAALEDLLNSKKGNFADLKQAFDNYFDCQSTTDYLYENQYHKWLFERLFAEASKFEGRSVAEDSAFFTQMVYPKNSLLYYTGKPKPGVNREWCRHLGDNFKRTLSDSFADLWLYREQAKKVLKGCIDTFSHELCYYVSNKILRFWRDIENWIERLSGVCLTRRQPTHPKQELAGLHNF
eukprot:TRINITY_DN10949_c0_g1_i1.p1 TRINITY_DN10949_c0_g1~~TRINITY_DN10949_c0_g1_i1.p1  ORF type:complete len:218 (-),score=21.36 TRINITY_DN10949_c0_g1_i1:208-861(-)